MGSLVRALLLLTCLVATGCARSCTRATAPSDGGREAVEAIRAYRGQDLRELDENRLRELLRHMSRLGLGLKSEDDAVKWYAPRYVWEYGKKDGQQFLLLFEADRQVLHPGSTRIGLTLLDAAGKVVSEAYLTTGWRRYLDEARLEPVDDGGYPLVTVYVSPRSGPGSHSELHRYAWVRGRFDLVRLADVDGHATRNRYYVRHFGCGPTVAERTEEEWVADLTSNERFRILRALVWLGGIHWDLQTEFKDDSREQYEAVEQVHLVRKVRASGKVTARLRELVKSEDQWIREAALLAAAPMDGHF